MGVYEVRTGVLPWLRRSARGTCVAETRERVSRKRRRLISRLDRVYIRFGLFFDGVFVYGTPHILCVTVHTRASEPPYGIHFFKTRSTRVWTPRGERAQSP